MHTKRLFFISIFLFLSLPALAVLDLRFSPPIECPETINVSDRVTFRVAFIAHGAPAYNVKVRGKIDCDPAHRFEQIFDYVPADTPTYVNFEWTATYHDFPLGMVTFIVDPACTTGDSDCTNNAIDRPFEIYGTPPALPDLKLTVTVSPINYKDGDKLKFQIKVENIGRTSAKNSRLFIKMGSNPTLDLETPQLTSPKISSRSSIIFTQFFPVKCNETVTIIADAKNEINETDERNNTWSKVTTCHSKTVNPMTPVYTTTGKKK